MGQREEGKSMADAKNAAPGGPRTSQLQAGMGARLSERRCVEGKLVSW